MKNFNTFFSKILILAKEILVGEEVELNQVGVEYILDVCYCPTGLFILKKH